MVIFLLFGTQMGYFVGRGQVKNLFGVYFYSATTFIFYVSFISDIRFGLILGLFWLFGALIGYFFGHSNFKKMFWV